MFINLYSRHFRHKWVCHQFRNGLYSNNSMSEISVSHTDLGAAIRHCPYPEIRDIIWVWEQQFLIFNIQKSLSRTYPHSWLISGFVTRLRACLRENHANSKTMSRCTIIVKSKMDHISKEKVHMIQNML
jgi:hypothetical protein